jgi:hypothetical protein
MKKKKICFEEKKRWCLKGFEKRKNKFGKFFGVKRKKNLENIF